MIRSITRGTASANGDKTISCTITDTSKVVVILDVDGTASGGDAYNSSNADYTCAGSVGVYLKSISTSNIIVTAHGFTVSAGASSPSIKTSNITFSYQIIEFM